MIKKHQLSYFLLNISIIIIIYLIFGIPNDIFIFISNFIILFLSLFCLLLQPDRYYSLTKVVYFFIFFFFGIIPLNDESKNNVYWSFKKLDLTDFQSANILIIIGIISFFLGNLAMNKNLKLFSKSEKNNIKFGTKFYGFSIIFLFIISFIILKDSDFSILRLLTRDTPLELANDDFTSQFNTISTTVIFDSIIKPSPVIYLFIYYYYYKKYIIKNFKSKLFLIFLFPLCLFLVSPTSLTRFMAAALYLPFVVFFTQLWEKPYRMQLTLMISLLFIFPLLNLFRYFNPDDFNFNLIKYFNFTFMDSGNFDAYQNFARVIHDNFINYGRQLIGSIFFFIPRSIWPNKPTGSGSTLADMNGQPFGNISMPYIAEGYINFGIFGVIFFMFFLGYILNTFDTLFWDNKKNKTTLFNVYYTILIGLIFFIMRGDMLSSTSYTIGLTICFIILTRFFKFIT